ncbi:uncharacterized protein B0P05DRAFT_569418 [Gilbertella persicaria]|uniref:uncharacterized protein n=1 Tax=Gilbertella persicaria TaxID=101096 RepID=UPI00221E5AA0|nr:uncharacterized protein B0P05DRAFT_569418 [Gilbertella persicaria]KAI8087964.1 hypothetical protein B0P05DRAFT_569418 [Gilbertella persicaria]
MDFSSFNLEDTSDIFKQNYQIQNHYDSNNNNNNNNNNLNNNSTGFFNFIGNTTHYENNSTQAYTMPQLSPDGHEESYTNSSVLSGHNPEFNMSPLQIASQPPTSNSMIHTYQTPIQHATEDYIDEEEFFTPLVSPAMAPTSHDSAYQSLMNLNENTFSPLSSPALHPSSNLSSMSDQTTLEQKLAFIERQQQQLRNMHNQLRPTTKASPILNTKKHYNTRWQVHKYSLFKVQGHLCPLALTPHTSFVNQSPLKSNTNNGFIAPATPSLLMKLGGSSGNSSSVPTSTVSSVVDNMPVLPAAILPPEEKKKPDKKRRRVSNFSSPGLSPSTDMTSPAIRPLVQQSPRALKPLISPSLKPDGKRLSIIEEETARALLTSKSNYENLKEGKAKSLGIDFSTTIQSGIENRRSAHKAAEQKRRDTLKQSFDSLRAEILEAMVEEEMTDTTNVAELKSAKEKDVKQMSKVVLLQYSYEYILRLKNENKRKDEKQHKMRQELIELRKRLGLPEVTAEEKDAEEKERQEESDRKEARMKRLKNAADAAANSDEV